jgi:hypothetical protein
LARDARSSAARIVVSSSPSSLGRFRRGTAQQLQQRFNRLVTFVHGKDNNFISAITKNEPVLCPVQQALDTQIFIQTAYLSAWKQKMTTLPPDTTIFTRELLRQPEE